MLSTPAKSIHEAPAFSTVFSCRAALVRGGWKEVLVRGAEGQVLGLLHAEDVARLAARVPTALLSEVHLRPTREFPHTSTVAELDAAMRNTEVEAVLLRREGALLAVFLRIEPGRVLEILARPQRLTRPMRRAA